MATTAIDEGKLEAFMGHAVEDMSAAMSAVMSRLGERCGLYAAMAHAGPLTSAQVAERAGCDERYVRDSILNPKGQVAAGYEPVMPTFAGQVSEDDLAKLVAYIESIGPERSGAR